MLFKVGELARRSGLTVRTLHYYDAIGLLKPSARADKTVRPPGCGPTPQGPGAASFRARACRIRRASCRPA